MNNTKKFLGARIQEIRKKSGMKQSQMAEIIGIDSKHLSKIECGYSYPSFDLLDKIASVLNVDLCEILSLDHLKNKEELLKEIGSLLKNQDIEKVKIAYRIIKNLTS